MFWPVVAALINVVFLIALVLARPVERNPGRLWTIAVLSNVATLAWSLVSIAYRILHA